MIHTIEIEDGDEAVIARGADLLRVSWNDTLGAWVAEHEKRDDGEEDERG